MKFYIYISTFWNMEFFIIDGDFGEVGAYLNATQIFAII